MKKLFSLCAALLALVLTTPPAAQAGDKSLVGTLMGAGLGGYFGSNIGKGDGQLAATGAGVFLGGLMGNSIGSSLDRADAVYARGGGFYSPSAPSFGGYQQTYVAPLEPAPPRIIYVEPEIVEYRRVETPVYVEEGFMGPPPGERQRERERNRGEKRHCREFTQTIKIDGQTHESYGTACLRPDGTWQIEP